MMKSWYLGDSELVRTVEKDIHKNSTDSNISFWKKFTPFVQWVDRWKHVAIVASFDHVAMIKAASRYDHKTNVKHVV